jgi:uroporphyrin-III C-methyltransferase
MSRRTLRGDSQHMTVYLVGAGPGDPELITVRGARLLAAADVVVYDRLAIPLLTLVGSTAELIDVGKAPGHVPIPQEEINAMLIDSGRRGSCVVRLKGGDPFVFGRGAEELGALVGAGVPVEVVPGISSSLGAPAVAGISLTIRGISQSFTVITGHEDPLSAGNDRWRALAALGETIVVLMGATRIGSIAACLLREGLPADTPVAAIYAATTGSQKVSLWTLQTVGDEPHDAPTTFVIGEVVRRQVILGNDVGPGRSL